MHDINHTYTLLARILIEKSVPNGTLLFVRDELRARRATGNK